MNNEKPIGVFDSGIGGLSVLKQFVRFLPFEKYIYLGDTGRVPYGNKSAETIKRYAKESVEFLKSKDVKLIIIACNTVSSVALDAVEQSSNVPFIGMIHPAVAAALRATQNNKLGIIGTRGTIASKAYNTTISQLGNTSSISITARACPLFVPLVEEGPDWIAHPSTRLIAEEYLKDFLVEGIDTLILGCTHYPFLHQLLSEILPGVALIDSGEHSAVGAIKLLAEMGALAAEKNEFLKKPDIDFFFTDIPVNFYDTAPRLLGFPIESPHRINLGQ